MNILPQTAQCQRCICRAVCQAGVAARVVSDPKNGITEKRRHEELLAEYMRLADEQNSHMKGSDDGMLHNAERNEDMIVIKKSQTADTRSCDFSKVTKETLIASSKQHIGDVQQAIAYFMAMLMSAGKKHDFDKLTGIDHFHADFRTGFKQTGWWDNHRKVNRHHLDKPDGIPQDVNLLDVLEMIADFTMAGMARTGSVFPITLPPEVLTKALENTAKLLKEQIEVVK